MVKFLLSFLFLSFTSIVTIVESSLISDQVCDRQLEYFDVDLGARKQWALFGEIKNYVKLFDLFQKYFFNQCLTRGQKCLRVFFEGTLLVPVVLQIV